MLIGLQYRVSFSSLWVDKIKVCKGWISIGNIIAIVNMKLRKYIEKLNKKFIIENW